MHTVTSLSHYEPIAYLSEALFCIHEEAEGVDIFEYMPRAANENKFNSDDEEPEWALYGNY